MIMYISLFSTHGTRELSRERLIEGVRVMLTTTGDLCVIDMFPDSKTQPCRTSVGLFASPVHVQLVRPQYDGGLMINTVRGI